MIIKRILKSRFKLFKRTLKGKNISRTVQNLCTNTTGIIDQTTTKEYKGSTTTFSKDNKEGI